MTTQTLQLGQNRFEILTRGDHFAGLGAIWIGGVQVRSGRLPLLPFTQTFPDNHEFGAFTLQGVDETPQEVRLRLAVTFEVRGSKMVRDHSFDPIYETVDWIDTPPAGSGELTLVLRTAQDSFNGVAFDGFSYHWEYASADTPLFFLLDRASWELDGDITGATVISQSSCSAPVAHFEADTAWSTEGIIHFDAFAAKQNPVMTHNLPRWASHGSFDYQYKGDNTLIGVFEHVDLIRSVLQRDAGKPELKTFDKYIFDQTQAHRTPAKSILLNSEPRSAVGQQNLWTWVMDEVHGRARAEFGLHEEPLQPRVSQNYWVKFTIDTYYRDLLPATIATGTQSVFIDNVNKSDLTEVPASLGYPGNMCCGHEYEPSPKLGGVPVLKRFVEDCHQEQISVFSWTNNDQSNLSRLNNNQPETQSWFVKMEDARLKYGGAYTNGFTIWSFADEGARRYWVDCLKKTKDETGLSGYLFDSFYNLGFMPVDYANMSPRTMWRQLLEAFKELQDYGVHFMIESFGPFGEVQHGCPTSYNLDTLFACYKIATGTGYTTVPTGKDTAVHSLWPADTMYRLLAHMTRPGFPLFFGEQRLDEAFTPQHKQALADYTTHLPHLHRRYLQEDEQSVLWHNEDATRATLWNFAARSVALPGTVTDATTGSELPPAATYSLEPLHTYVITGTDVAALTRI